MDGISQVRGRRLPSNATRSVNCTLLACFRRFLPAILAQFVSVLCLQFAINSFIAGLARRLGHPGLSLRTQFIFNQALQHGFVRWGRKSRLVAGAAIIIALREAQRGETVKDIAVCILPSCLSRSY